MHRLYLQIYAAVLTMLIVFALLLALAFWHFDREEGRRDFLSELTLFADAIVPPLEASDERLQRWAEAIADPLELDLTIFGPEHEMLVQIGERLPPPPNTGGSRWVRHRMRRRTIALALSDGRWIVASGERPGPGRPLGHFLIAIVILGLASAVAAFPLARRLTRRLESLQTQVEALGAGRLDVRVPVQGHDEVADLARAFNATADRIEALVEDKTRLLANTSHELRTPLARVRVALELMGDAPRPELLARIDHDIAELDDLIGELLIASRLDAPGQSLAREPVDLLALAAEEAARLTGVDVRGASQMAAGDPRLLRRLVRNLLENGLRHGEPPVEVEVAAGEDSGWVRMSVADHGDGVPEDERERIFAPFYRPAGQASAEGGIGLGLALVRQIAERHGGRVDCLSREGGGTRFVVALPAVDGSLGPDAPDRGARLIDTE